MLNKVGIMQCWLDIMKFIVLFTVTMIFVLYVIKKYESENAIKKVTEAFEVSSDTHTKYFDLSSNYNTYYANEVPAPLNPVQDNVILNIGGAFGSIDTSQIPWDSENKELTTAEALWGVVPPDISYILFRKMYMAFQLDNMDNLPFDENSNAYYYEDPMFGYGTNSEKMGATSMAADFYAQAEVQAFATYLGEKAMEKEGGQAAHFTPMIKHLYDFIAGRAKSVYSLATKTAAERAATPKVIPKKVTPAKMGWFKSGLKNVYNDAGKLIVEAITDTEKGILKTASFAAKAAKLVAKALILKIGQKVLWLIGMSFAILFSFAWMGPVGEMLDTIYMFIIMPLVIVLSLPFSPVMKVIEHWADATGCCPLDADGVTQTVALDAALPQIAETMISMIPIVGDLLSIMYPFICYKISDGTFVGKGKMILPRYITNKQWLTSYYFDWPPYNCTLKKEPVVYGKDPAPSQWVRYTDFNSIKANPYNYNLIDKRMEGWTAIYDEYTILPNVNSKIHETNVSVNGSGIAGTSNFFYCDFSDPYVMIQMAQLYYDYATRNPFPNDDGTVTVQYISKINYVIASSLGTCDVLCEMNNVTYNSINGSKYSEVVSIAHDRRFYFGIDLTKSAPDHWETKNTSSTGWGNITYPNALGNVAAGNGTYWMYYDDAYDAAVLTLNNTIHSSPYVNTSVTAELLATAYRLQIRSYNNYLDSTSNAYSDTTMNPAFIIAEYKSQYISDYANYSNIIVNSLAHPYNATPNAFGKFIPNDSATSTLESQLSTLVGCSNAFWEYQKSISDVTKNTYTQYTVYGCTHLDATASGAPDPGVMYGEEDMRKEVNFNVLPYIKRCTKPAIDMNKCADASNIEQIIDAYALQKQTRHIKSIKKILPKGQNVCQYVWDEVDYDAATQKETNFYTTTNNVLYQIDLSSCTFCLPKNSSNQPLIYGATVGSNLLSEGSLGVPPTTTYPKTISTIVNGAQTGTTTVDIQSVNAYKYPTPVYSINGNIIASPNSNVTLSYNKSFYYTPTYDAGLKQITGVSLNANVDDLYRFDPITAQQLSTISRPKAPIRVTYPMPAEQNLGNIPNDYCGLTSTMKFFMMDYNANPKNANNKILKIIRAYTSGQNTCDYEFDVLTGNNVERVTQSFTMAAAGAASVANAEGFQAAYTYDSNATNNNLDDNGITGFAAPGKGAGLGLGINKKTYGLPGNLSTIGYGYASPYLNNFTHDIAPNVVYFNDNLISNFTNTTQQLASTTQAYLVALKGNVYLGGDTSCKKKCDDPVIMQSIMEQYNLDNYASGRYGVSTNAILQMVRAATDSVSTCHMIFENDMEIYGDAYSANTFINNPANSASDSNNYYTENRLFLKEFQMKSGPTSCSFVPVPNQVIDISASDLALATSTDFNNYVAPIRPNCQVLCSSNNPLTMQALKDYANNSGNYGNTVYASMPVGYDTCDYAIQSQVFNVPGEGILEDQPYVLRVKYNYPLYTGTSNCSSSDFSYTSGSYQVQIPGITIDVDDPTLSPLFSYADSEINNVEDPINRFVNSNNITGFN